MYGDLESNRHFIVQRMNYSHTLSENLVDFNNFIQTAFEQIWIFNCLPLIELGYYYG